MIISFEQFFADDGDDGLGKQDPFRERSPGLAELAGRT
jgi:hypothetical protein